MKLAGLSKETKVSYQMKIAVFASVDQISAIAEQFPVEFVFSDHRDAYVLEREG